MIELVDMDIERMIKTVFHTFKKSKEYFNMLIET